MAKNDISLVQLAILGILNDCEEGKLGPEIRDEMAQRGLQRPGPTFYQLMGRLEDNEYITGIDTPKIINNKTYHHRKYKITKEGAGVFAEHVDAWGKATARRIVRLC